MPNYTLFKFLTSPVAFFQLIGILHHHHCRHHAFAPQRLAHIMAANHTFPNTQSAHHSRRNLHGGIAKSNITIGFPHSPYIFIGSGVHSAHVVSPFRSLPLFGHEWLQRVARTSASSKNLLQRWTFILLDKLWNITHNARNHLNHRVADFRSWLHVKTAPSRYQRDIVSTRYFAEPLRVGFLRPFEPKLFVSSATRRIYTNAHSSIGWRVYDFKNAIITQTVAAEMLQPRPAPDPPNADEFVYNASLMSTSITSEQILNDPDAFLSLSELSISSSRAATKGMSESLHDFMEWVEDLERSRHR